MNPHIAQTIADLTGRIDKLQHIVNALTELDGAPAAEPPPPPKAATKKAKTIRAPRAHSDTLSAARDLTEPLTSGNLSARTGLTTKGASSALLRWCRDGLVEKVSVGKYRRTAKFPGSTPGSTNGHTKVPTHSAATQDYSALRKELDAAIKSRDHARENGRDAIVDVFQRDIDRLEGLMAK